MKRLNVTIESTPRLERASQRGRKGRAPSAASRTGRDARPAPKYSSKRSHI